MVRIEQDYTVTKVYPYSQLGAQGMQEATTLAEAIEQAAVLIYWLEDGE